MVRIDQSPFKLACYCYFICNKSPHHLLVDIIWLVAYPQMSSPPSSSIFPPIYMTSVSPSSSLFLFCFYKYNFILFSQLNIRRCHRYHLSSFCSIYVATPIYDNLYVPLSSFTSQSHHHCHYKYFKCRLAATRYFMSFDGHNSEKMKNKKYAHAHTYISDITFICFTANDQLFHSRGFESFDVKMWYFGIHLIRAKKS